MDGFPCPSNSLAFTIMGSDSFLSEITFLTEDYVTETIFRKLSRLVSLTT